MMRRFKMAKSPADVNCSLQHLVAVAARRFPYYRELVQSAGGYPPEVNNLEALRCLPITNKAEILSRFSAHRSTMRPPKVDKVKWSTSGTSGPVLLVHMSRTESAFRTLSYFQAIKENARFSFPLSVAHVGAGRRESSKRPSLLQHLARVRIVRICRLLPVEEQIAKLVESHSQIITGHPSCLELIAERMVETSVAVQTKLVVCRGEVLQERVRALLARAFGCKIVDYYNAEEIGNIAYECPVEPARMHVNTDTCILEILDEAGTPQPVGVEGRVVVTNLFNHTMPFIRYDLGDRGTLMQLGETRCRCGSLRPTILAPSGRTDDFFSFPSGIRLSPRAVESLVMPTLLRALQARSGSTPGMPAYQVIQESGLDIRLRIEGALPAREKLRMQIEQGIIQHVGLPISLRIDDNQEIRPGKSGKARRVVSKVERT